MNVILVTANDQQSYEREWAHSERLLAHLRCLGCRPGLVSIPQNDPDLLSFELRESAHMLHAFHAVRCGLACREIARKTRVPFIVSCVGSDIYIDLLNPGLQGLLADTLLSADRVVVPVAHMQKWLEERLPRLRTTVVIPRSTEKRVPVEPLNRSQFGFEPNHRLLLLAGGVRPVKNPLFAVKAVAPLIKLWPDLRLVIVGPVVDHEYGKRFQEAIAATPWVVFIGERPSEEMPKWYQEAEIILNVSHVEGGSGDVLEAMALGKPVIAADIPGNRAYIRYSRSDPESSTGLLYFTSSAPEGYQRVHDREDFAELLRTLLNDPERAIRMGQRAAYYAKSELRPDLEAYRYWQLYREVLGK
ncbi:MAG: glycosyltransferase family 4 protein [Candidatus Riflebacteria bacterium]|nr:glycosyltransferase family 4 protein [Candidatus Riflebacteria bacterium]